MSEDSMCLEVSDPHDLFPARCILARGHEGLHRARVGIIGQSLEWGSRNPSGRDARSAS